MENGVVMTESVLRTKSKEFAIDCVFLVKKLKERKTEYALINQFIRSSTSIGANIHEGKYAQGTKDLISKFEISLKECNETEYWLEIFYSTKAITKEEYDIYKNKCIEICRMLVASVKTLKTKLNVCKAN